VLAQRTGAQVICGYCERVSDGKFRIRIEPALDPASFPSPAALNAAIAATSSRHIREHIDQWCIFRPMWELAPGEAADLAHERRRVPA
jgi:lauroyl/myristoyl acyltransferase